MTPPLRLSRLHATLVLLALTLLFGGRRLSPRPAIPADALSNVPPWSELLGPGAHNGLLGDVVLSVYPNRRFVHDELAAGRFPLWNPYVLLGRSTVDDPNMAVFYPATLGLAWLSPEKALDVQIFVHLAIGLAGTYRLVRRLGGSRHGGLLAATAFMGSSALTVWQQYTNLFSAGVWLPWLLLAYERTRTAPHRRRAIVGAAAVLGLVALANFVQWLLYDLLLLAAWTLWRDRMRGAGRFAAITALGLGLGAVQWIPLLALYADSERAVAESVAAMASQALPARALLTAIVPDYFGTPLQPASAWGPGNYAERTLYFGLIPLGLALAAIAAVPRSRFWGVAALVAISAVIGLPTLALFSFPSALRALAHTRLIYVACFAGAVAAGLGVDRLADAIGTRRRVVGLVAALAAVAALACRLEAWPDSVERGPIREGVWRAAALAAWGIVALRRPEAWLAGTVVEMALFAVPYNAPPRSPVPLFPEPQALESVPRGGGIRVAAVHSRDLLFLPNSLMALGRAEPGGYTSLVPARVRSFFRALNGDDAWSFNTNTVLVNRADSPLLDLTRSAYVVSAQPLSTRGLELRAQADGIHLYHNREAAPRAFLVARAVSLPDRAALEAALGEAAFDWCRAAFLVDSAAAALPGTGGCVGRAEVVHDSGPHVALRVTSPSPAMLVLTDAYVPGWRATVDGRAADVYEVDGLLRGVLVGPGTSDVRFTFRPAALRAGAMISSGSLALALAALAFPRRRPRAPQTADARS